MALLTKLGKLRGRGLQELRVRGGQALRSFAERNFGSLTALPDDRSLVKLLDPRAPSTDTLLDRFRLREETNRATFFISAKRKKQTINELLLRWPNARNEIVEAGDRIVAGKFDLLGYRQLSFGDPIDWHLEPVSGRRSPAEHWSRIDEFDVDKIGDQKITRELSRHQYFIILGQAYWITDDERYARTFVSHLESWMDQNPPKLGTHWSSSLEIAFRSISWLWAFHFFKHSRSLTNEVFTRALKFLYVNARHVETYLSTYFSPNTHLTGEALGLFYLGSLLPEFEHANRWKTIGRKILLDQLPIHVRADGVYFESSSYYHRYTADFYTHFLLLSRLTGDDVPTEVEDRLQALMDHLMYITRPDGTTPFYGDDDGGRLLFLDRSRSNDFGAVLSNGAVLFQRPDYKFVAGSVREETLWLMGHESLKTFDDLAGREPAQTCAAFHASGYYVMRDGWSPQSNFLLFDCGPHGTVNGGHAHADALSFELAANGRTLLIDPGTHTYTASKKLRDWFRGSEGHNTLVIDDQPSSVTGDPFSWKFIAGSRCSNSRSQAVFNFVEGSHDGYTRLDTPLTHARSIFFLKNGYWILCDRLTGRGNHEADLLFHFPPGVTLELESNSELAALGEGENLLSLNVFGSSTGEWKRETGWVSYCYGSIGEAPVARFSTRVVGDANLITFLLPQNGALQANLTVREVEAINGRGFEVSHEGGFDVVMIATAPGREVETERLASDFAWTWARFSNHEDRMPTDLILLDGAVLKLEGREMLKSSARLSYLVAQRIGEEFSVETEGTVLNLRLPVPDLEAVFRHLGRQVSG
ncbi:MAG TPA: alginate lyase family protein [Pyrinomonadaceae bacterium]|nr:alginate lyase family protein [Pyrinomonadaceae bacterium]